MILLYNFSIFLFYASIRVASVFGNSKAAKWMAGRKNIFNHMTLSLKPDEKRIWFHCASLGEFEQGRPVMEKFRMQHPEIKIVLTFFSPSGYEVRKNYQGADYVFYLPLDTARNAEKFITLVNPEKVFFVKYEFWFHYLNSLYLKNIPVYLISAVFRPGQLFFKWYGGFFRKILKLFSHIFLQDNESAIILKSAGISHHTITGDTRFDRVVDNAAGIKPIPVIEKFKNDNQLIIAGSTWNEDEQIIQSLMKSIALHALPVKLVIASHEITEHKITGLLNLFSAFKTSRWSSSKEETVSASNVLIIDNIGMLSSIYQYGNFAYIGGGFGKGIHNILEAAVFGMPVFFGPNYSKFVEAKELIEKNGAIVIHSANELNSEFYKMMNDKNLLKEASLATRNYVYERKGATEKITKVISEL